MRIPKNFCQPIKKMSQYPRSTYQGLAGTQNLPPVNVYNPNLNQAPLFDVSAGQTTPRAPQRVSASPRRSPLPAQTNVNVEVTRENENKGFSVQRASVWAYIIISLIVIGIIWLIIRNSLANDYYDAVRKPSWAPTSQVLFVGWIIAIIVLGIIASRGNIGLADAADIEHAGSTRNSIAIAYGIIVILLILWALVFFVQRNATLALVIGILAWLVALWLLWLLWNVDRTAAYLLILYLIWHTYIVIVNWSIVNLNRPVTV